MVSEDLLAIKLKQIKVKKTKLIYLGLSILEISKVLMCECWRDYIKPKYQNNAKLCYMDTDSFVIHIASEDFYKDIADDAKNRYDKEMNKNVIGLLKDELGGKFITEFVAHRPKTYPYLTDYDQNVKKLNEQKNV